MRVSLHRSASFRVMMLACFAFMAVGAAVIGFFYWSTVYIIDNQIDSALARESNGLTAVHERDGYEGLRETVAIRTSPDPGALRIYLLQGRDGSLTGDLKQWPADAPEPGKTAEIVIPGPARRARVRTLAFAGGSRLLVGRSLSERDDFQRIASRSLLGVLAADLLLGASAGIFLARYADRRLGPINAAAQDVIEGNLSVRAAVGNGVDEYGYLAQNINAMLDRVQRLVATLNDVTENIAHDLRAPLHRMRGRLEVALMAPRSTEEYRALLQRTMAEAETIAGTFNGILKIGRLKASALDLPNTPVDLAEIVEEIAELYQAFAEETGVTLEALLPEAAHRSGRSLLVMGDAHAISQAAANLLDNAIKYTPAGGKVVISAEQKACCAILRVADNGPGIPAEKRAATLERFVRLEKTADKPGFGVGLSFVSAVADWHGAQLTLADNNPGLLATLSFPAAKPAGQ